MFALTPVSFLALAAHAAAFPTLEHMKQITGAEVDENTIAEIARLQALSNAPFVVGRATFDAPIDGNSIHPAVDCTDETQFQVNMHSLHQTMRAGT